MLNVSYTELAKAPGGCINDWKQVIYQDHTTGFQDTFHLGQDEYAVRMTSHVMKRQTCEDYIEGRVAKRYLTRIGFSELNPIRDMFDFGISPQFLKALPFSNCMPNVNASCFPLWLIKRLAAVSMDRLEDVQR